MNLEAIYLQAEQALQMGRLQQALPLLRQAADGGHGGACQRLAQYLLHFEVSSPAPSATAATEALQRLQQARAAGHPAGAYLWACVALGGHLLPRDPVEIARCLLEAARAGMPAAERAVAWLMAEHGAVDAPAAVPAAAQPDAAAPDAAVLGSASLSEEALSQSIQRGLQVPAHQTLATAPRVSLVPALLSEAACRLLVQVASVRLRPSTVHDPVAALTRRDPLRSSSDCALDPLEEDFILRWIQTRMAVAADCDLVQAEHLVVLQYAPGQEYRPHRDDLNPTALQRHRPDAGQRWRTLCTYLSAVESGGETDFPLLGVRVRPQMGHAVLFDSLDAQGQPDARSLHAGLPVLAGQKWLATLWWRQKPYRAW